MDFEDLCRSVNLIDCKAHELSQDVAELSHRLAQISEREEDGIPAKLEDVIRYHIRSVLKIANGNKTEAAKILGLKRTTLVEKMKRLGMM